MHAKKITFILLPVLVIGLAVSWNCSGKSEEDLIRDTVKKIGEYAEERDAVGIMTLISEDYSDTEERTKTDIETLLDENFDRYSGIVVNILGTKIVEINPPNAKIEIDTAFSSGAARAFRKIVRFSGHCYRFDVDMVKDIDQWKVKNASWQYISTDELTPEAMKAIKEVFPKL
jgi:hypothetical protein